MLELSFDRFQTGSSFQNFVGNNSILQQKTHPPQVKKSGREGVRVRGVSLLVHQGYGLTKWKYGCAGELSYGRVESHS